METGNALAFNDLGGSYCTGRFGVQQDYQKANELFLKAGELGCASAYNYNNLGNLYHFGNGVEIDKKKAKHLYELAAMAGNIDARYNRRS